MAGGYCSLVLLHVAASTRYGYCVRLTEDFARRLRSWTGAAPAPKPGRGVLRPLVWALEVYGSSDGALEASPMPVSAGSFWANAAFCESLCLLHWGCAVPAARRHALHEAQLVPHNVLAPPQGPQCWRSSLPSTGVCMGVATFCVGVGGRAGWGGGGFPKNTLPLPPPPPPPCRFALMKPLEAVVPALWHFNWLSTGDTIGSTDIPAPDADFILCIARCLPALLVMFNDTQAREALPWGGREVPRRHARGGGGG